MIMMIYSDDQIGKIEYNYFPIVFYDLIKNFMDVQRCINKNFRIKFETLVMKNTKNIKNKKIQAKIKFKEMYENFNPLEIQKKLESQRKFD